jgi:hypothetical protein
LRAEWGSRDAQSAGASQKPLRGNEWKLHARGLILLSFNETTKHKLSDNVVYNRLLEGSKLTSRVTFKGDMSTLSLCLSHDRRSELWPLEVVVTRKHHQICTVQQYFPPKGRLKVTMTYTRHARMKNENNNHQCLSRYPAYPKESSEDESSV